MQFLKIISYLFAFTIGTAEFCLAQNVFYQDIYNGGITFAGCSSANASGEIELPIFIEPGSNIRKIYLITISQNQNLETIDDILINVDGQDFVQNFTSNYLISANWPFNPSNVGSHTIHISDITNELTIDNSSLTIAMPQQLNPPFPCPSCVYSAPGLLILYDNPLLSQICVVLSANNKSQDSEINFIYNDLYPPILMDDIAFALHTDRVGANLNDGYEIYVNGNTLGAINVEDVPSIYGGTVGNFYFQNGQNFGLTDDTADPFMSGSDALANINNYVSDLNNLQIGVNYIVPTTAYHNNVVGLYFAYSTPCEPFDVITSNDTIICEGSSLQLNASTSNPAAVYEWQPATGLSCTNCPNPIFTADSSMFYTVRIWNNDSCSVVRPLKINVRPRPSFGDVEMMPSECGASAGSVTLFSLAGNGSVQSWSELGGNSQTSNVFQNMSSGFHTFNFTDTNGCQSADTTIFISEINSTIASFSANPSSGVAPLEVEFTNTSSNATNFEWFVDGNLGGNIANLPTWEFENSGYYEITLVAWQFDPSCADTFALTIMVYDSLIVQVPNVFTPNGDGINDFFAITSSLPVDVELVILNRWGVDVYKYSGSLNVGLNNLWSGSSVTDGTYFYTMKISKNEDTPFVKELENPMEKTGFVEVRR